MQDDRPTSGAGAVSDDRLAGDDRPVSLEGALARTEADAGAALKAAAAVTTALKQLQKAAREGNLRELRDRLAASEQALSGLRDRIEQAEAGWDLDEDAYLADGAFPRELLDAARQLDVRIFEHDDRLYCYPSLIRVLASDRAVLIDKTRERRLRPSVLVKHLKDLQGRPARFKPEAFLQALFTAYGAIVARHGKGALRLNQVEKLQDVYDLLTLLPGQSREYSKQEFARDVYLLDRSGVTTTRQGYTVSFSASTGTRAPGSTIRVITEDGRDKVYYGILFTLAG